MTEVSKLNGNLRLAVNGTLMRGLELHPNMLGVGAEFIEEAKTAPCYRLWSIGDRHPAMMRVEAGGVSVALEIYEISADGLASVLRKEPAGLCVGKVMLDSGDEVLGVLGESFLCEKGKEITEYGGWRSYIATLSNT